MPRSRRSRRSISAVAAIVSPLEPRTLLSATPLPNGGEVAGVVTAGQPVEFAFDIAAGATPLLAVNLPDGAGTAAVSVVEPAGD